MAIHKYSFPTQIHFGAGARFEVAPYLMSHGLKRPLVVTDRGLSTLPLFNEMLEAIRMQKIEAQVFADIYGNPVKSQVMSGVAAFRSSKADSIIGFGGGAALDVAKAIALMVHHPGDLFDYEDEKPGALPIDKEIPHWVALPTTSGTGSEVGRSSVISDDQTHVKKVVFSPRLMARAVFADPVVTSRLPAGVTASTGMDALTHCVEAYLAKNYHPMCDGIALEGLRLVAKSLERVVKVPDDLDARSDMMMASMMGAVAFQKGLGVTHSCAHALSIVSDLHHGLANGVLIDHALKINLDVVPERFERMARTIGLKSTRPQDFIAWLTDLKRNTGIPEKLGSLGVDREKIDELVKMAVQDGCHLNNPRPCTAEDFRTIFNEAL